MAARLLFLPGVPIEFAPSDLAYFPALADSRELRLPGMELRSSTLAR